MRSDWLRSQGLGLICGLSTVLLLAVGSVVVAATRDGASAGVMMDDVTVFFRDPSPVHLWFYLLLPVLGLYALNTLLATWHSVVTKWRSGKRSLQVYGPAVIHVAFLLALLAHGVGGLLGAERGMVMVGPQWAPLGDGRAARLVDVGMDTHPNGQPWQVTAVLEVRPAGAGPEQAGAGERVEVAYNRPLSTGFGAGLHIIQRFGSMPTAVRLAFGDEDCTVPVQGSCRLDGHRVRLEGIRSAGHWGNTPVAILRAEAEDGGTPAEDFFLWQGAERPLGTGWLRLTALEEGPAVMLRARSAPGNPWALAAAVVLGAGLLMMGRRWV